VKAEDDWHHGDASSNPDDGGARTKLCESIRGTTGAALRHHAIVRASGKDRVCGSEVCLNSTRTPPDREESAEPAQDSRADPPSTNNERPEPEPPDARLCWRGNAQGEGFVVTTVRRTDENAWPRVLETIEPISAHAQAKDPTD